MSHKKTGSLVPLTLDFLSDQQLGDAEDQVEPYERPSSPSLVIARKGSSKKALAAAE